MNPKDDFSDLLKSIELSGSADLTRPEAKIILLNKNPDSILDKSSGLSRIKPSITKQFELAICHPPELSALSSLEIRCFNCNQIISYPAWVLKKEFKKNIFYYFLCCRNEDVKIVCV